MQNKRSILKKLFATIFILFLLMNVVAYFHAYKFTHFSTEASDKTKDPSKLNGWQKIKTLLTGVNNPRPENLNVPKHPYETIVLNSNKKIECWYMKADTPKGTVILYHGYSGSKSKMLQQAEVLLLGGYNTLLVDFMGSGESEGNQTTIGFYEAEEVKSSFDYVAKSGEQHIFLFGTSMGAAAIMKALKDYPIHPNGIIVECPFGSMLQTVQARFKTMHAPCFPMANLLVFWGGFQNGFNAFSHNPETYASSISCPVLLLAGGGDNKVSVVEIDTIYAHLSGPKRLKVYPLAGHESYLKQYRKEWTDDVLSFLNSSISAKSSR